MLFQTVGCTWNSNPRPILDFFHLSGEVLCVGNSEDRRAPLGSGHVPFLDLLACKRQPPGPSIPNRCPYMELKNSHATNFSMLNSCAPAIPENRAYPTHSRLVALLCNSCGSHYVQKWSLNMENHPKSQTTITLHSSCSCAPQDLLPLRVLRRKLLKSVPFCTRLGDSHGT
jgi:hypothetical protein